MDNHNKVSPIIDYVKSANLKGKINLGDNKFGWDLGNILLNFIIDKDETTVEYLRYTLKNSYKYIGHLHIDNNDVINLIKDINNENNIIKITVSFLGSTFTIIDKNTIKKKSGILIRHYYLK